MIPPHLPQTREALLQTVLLASHSIPLIILIQKACSEYVQGIVVGSATPVYKVLDLIHDSVHAADGHNVQFFADKECTHQLFKDSYDSITTITTYLRSQQLQCVYPVHVVSEAVFHIYMSSSGHTHCHQHH